MKAKAQKHLAHEVGKALDKVDKLDPGTGQLDIGFKVDKKEAQATLDYQHRVKKNLSLFATGEVARNWGTGKVRGQVMGGLRLRF